MDKALSDLLGLKIVSFKWSEKRLTDWPGQSVKNGHYLAKSDQQ